jgi:hypothetical protein
MSSSETTLATEIGYASKPERVLSAWLWPGPRIWHGDPRGPVCFLITRSKALPCRHEDVIGRVS